MAAQGSQAKISTAPGCGIHSNDHYDLFPCLLEHKTCDIFAAERLRLMRFDNRLIIDSFQS